MLPENRTTNESRFIPARNSEAWGPQAYQVLVRQLWNSAWAACPRSLTLDEKDVHVWRIHLRFERARIFALTTALHSDEWERANQFRHEKDRFEFVAARAVLKDILSRYLGRDARSLRICYARNGKPKLADGTLHFNLSHSHGVAAIIVSRNLEVGVDVERIQPRLVAEENARSFMSENELATFRSLTGEQRVDFFFRLWTRKESFLKACGEGHRIPAERVPCLDAAQKLTQSGRQQSCTVSDFCPAAGYTGAIAVFGQVWNATRLTWN
jgi:4'-phosphopantetheinyl transferase